MNIKRYLACLIALPLAACVAGSSESGEEVGRAAQAIGIEYVKNPHFDLPANASETEFMRPKFEQPRFDDENDQDGSHWFEILSGISKENLGWWGQFNDLYGIDGPADKRNLYIRFMPGQVLVSAARGVRGGLTQYFQNVGGQPVYMTNDPDLGWVGPTLSVRIKREFGSQIVQLLKDNHGITCSIEVNETNAPKGQWVTLSKTCTAPDGYNVDPTPNDPYTQVTVQAFGDGLALVDRLSVTKPAAVQPPNDEP